MERLAHTELPPIEFAYLYYCFWLLGGGQGYVPHTYVKYTGGMSLNPEQDIKASTFQCVAPPVIFYLQQII